MAGFFQNQPCILIGVALIVASSFLITQSESNPEYEGSKGVEKHMAHTKSRKAMYYWNESLADHYWFNIGEGKNESKPNGTFYSDELIELEVNLDYPINISGHKIKDVNLTSVGCVQSVDDLYQWAVCPLVIDTSLVPAEINFVNAVGGVLIVQWDMFPYALHDDLYGDQELKMQVQVFPDGKVMFVYKKIPLRSTRNFKNNFFYFITDVFGFNFRDILPDGKEYPHDIMLNIHKHEIKQGAILAFEALPFCPNYRTCKSCSKAKIKMGVSGETVPCVWCPGIKRCSSKRDYLHKYWLSNDCGNQEISNPRRCPKLKGPVKKTTEEIALVKLIKCVIVTFGTLTLSVFIYEHIFEGEDEEEEVEEEGEQEEEEDIRN